jgi:lipoprotein LprG
VRESRLFRFVALTCVVLLIVSCGGDSGSAVDDTGDIAVADVLDHASQRMAETESMRFDLRVDGVTYIDPNHTIQLASAKGTMARPGRVDVEFKVRLFGAGTVTIKMITVGDASWTTNLLTGNWETAPEEFGYNPSILYDNQDGLGPVMGKIDNPVLVGTESVNNRDAYHVKGTATEQVMDPLTANTMEGDQIGIELWIDGESWNLLRVVLREPESSPNQEPATWTMNLTDHDQQVSIEPPI